MCVSSEDLANENSKYVTPPPTRRTRHREPRITSCPHASAPHTCLSIDLLQEWNDDTDRYPGISPGSGSAKWMGFGLGTAYLVKLRFCFGGLA